MLLSMKRVVENEKKFSLLLRKRERILLDGAAIRLQIRKRLEALHKKSSNHICRVLADILNWCFHQMADEIV